MTIGAGTYILMSPVYIVNLFHIIHYTLFTMIEPHLSKVQNNIKKVKGQMELVLKMLDEGRYCVDIIQQCNAAIGLLRQANNSMLESHLNTCGKKLHSSNKTEKEDFIKEIIRICNVSTRKL